MNGNVQSALRGVKREVVSTAKVAWLGIKMVPSPIYVIGLVFNIVVFNPAAAMAVTTTIAAPSEENVTIASFIGCANFNWAAGFVPLAREATSLISGLGYVLIALLVLVLGIRYMLSGRSSERVSGVQQAAKSWGIGSVILVFGVPAVVLLLGGITIGCEYLS